MAHSARWRDRRFGRDSTRPHDRPPRPPQPLPEPEVPHEAAPPKATPPVPPDGYPQPLQGFDYDFGAVG